MVHLVDSPEDNRQIPVLGQPCPPAGTVLWLSAADLPIDEACIAEQEQSVVRPAAAIPSGTRLRGLRSSSGLPQHTLALLLWTIGTLLAAKRLLHLPSETWQEIISLIHRSRVKR